MVRVVVARSGGTGTIIGRRGRTHVVLTAGHVVVPTGGGCAATQPNGGCGVVRVDAFSPDEFGRPAQVVRLSLCPDLALLRVELDTPRRPMPLAEAGPYPGERVMAVGCPGGLRPWWSAGFVVGTGYRRLPVGTWCINASVVGGCSGGPVIDTHTGDLVGVVSGGLLVRSGPFSASPMPAMGAMVPSDAVVRWLEECRE